MDSTMRAKHKTKNTKLSKQLLSLKVQNKYISSEKLLQERKTGHLQNIKSKKMQIIQKHNL